MWGTDEMGRPDVFLLQKKHVLCATATPMKSFLLEFPISGPTLPREASFASEKGRSCAVESSRIYGIYVLADLEQHTTKLHQ